MKRHSQVHLALTMLFESSRLWLEGWIPWFVDIYTEQRDQLAKFLKEHQIGDV